MSGETSPRGWTAEEAAEMGRRSGLARKRAAELSPEQRAVESAAKRSPELIRELLKAAFGEGEFSDLKPELRVAAIKAALEYGIGKPTVARREDTAPTEVPHPEDLFGMRTES